MGPIDAVLEVFAWALSIAALVGLWSAAPWWVALLYSVCWAAAVARACIGSLEDWL